MKKSLTIKFISIFFISFIILFGIGKIAAEDNSASEQTSGANSETGDITGSHTEGSADQNNINRNNEGNILKENASGNAAVDSSDIKKTKDDTNLNLNKEKKENNKKIEQKQPVKPAGNPAVNSSNTADKPAGNINELLEINDGDFKYKRIPGISLQKEKAVNENTGPEPAKMNPEIKETSNDKESKGLFGFKKSTSDILIKVFLICLIIGIIILFKFRSKGHGGRGHGKVLRRFPGA